MKMPKGTKKKVNNKTEPAMPQDEVREEEFESDDWSYDPKGSSAGCVFGVPGCGKTYLLGLALKHNLIETAFVIDTDRGLKPLKQMGVLDRVEFKFYRDFDYQKPVAYTEMFNDLADFADGKFEHGIVRGTWVGSEVKKGAIPSLICMDSLSGTSRITMNQVLSDRKGIKQKKDAYHPTDAEFASLPDYGLFATRMEELLDIITGLEVLFYCTAHEQPMSEREGHEDSTKVPQIVGSIRRNLFRYFDEVWRLKAERSKDGGLYREAQTRADNFAMCRTRDNAMPEYIENPTLKEMLFR